MQQVQCGLPDDIWVQDPELWQLQGNSVRHLLPKEEPVPKRLEVRKVSVIRRVIKYILPVMLVTKQWSRWLVIKVHQENKQTALQPWTLMTTAKEERVTPGTCPVNAKMEGRRRGTRFPPSLHHSTLNAFLHVSLLFCQDTSEAFEFYINFTLQYFDNRAKERHWWLFMFKVGKNVSLYCTRYTSVELWSIFAGLTQRPILWNTLVVQWSPSGWLR